VRDRRLVFRDEGREGDRARHAAAFGQQAQRLITLVARSVEQGARVGVREEDRSLRGFDRLRGRERTAVGQVDRDPLPVELTYHVTAEGGQARITRLEAAGPEQVLIHVRELDDPNSELAKHAYVRKLVLDGRCVLEAEDDADLAGRFGGADVF